MGSRELSDDGLTHFYSLNRNQNYLRKEFSSNIILLLFINLLIKPIYVFGIDAQVQNRLGDESYGVYFALFNFCFLFQILLDVGIQNYNSRKVAQDRSAVTTDFPYILGTKLFLFVIFLFTIYCGAQILNYPNEYDRLIIGLGVVMFLQVTYVFLRSHFSALGHYKLESYASALDKVLMILVLGYFIYLRSEISIELFIKGQLMALLLSCLLVLAILSRYFPVRIKFSISRTTSLLQKSAPFALVILLMTLYTRMDGVMLERLLEDNGRSAGVYATGYRILDAVNILGYLFAMLLLPMFSRLLSEEGKVYPLLSSALGLIFSFATIATGIAIVFAPELLDMIYLDIGQENTEVFRLLMLSFWFMSIAYIYGSLITASGDLKIFNVILLLGIVCNWALNLWLIPKEKAVGAALATVITQGAVCIGQVVLATNRHKLSHQANLILKLISFMGITFAFMYLANGIVSLPWYVECVLLTGILLVISFLLGLFRLKWIGS